MAPVKSKSVLVPPCRPIAVLVASHIGMFRETEGDRKENVDFGLGLGSILVAATLIVATLYHRWFGAGPSVYDEIALLTLTIPMFVTGMSWKVNSTTMCGSLTLFVYLVVLIVSLAYQPQVAIGIYMAAGGAVVFAIGILLSVFRDKLMEIPEQVANRTGVFRILNWR
jgi:hypothetical protein